MPKSSSVQRVRDYRKRKRETQDREEFRQFLNNTPFTSSTTEVEKYQAFREKLNREKALNSERKRAERKSKVRQKHAERSKRYRLKRKLEAEQNREKECDDKPVRSVKKFVSEHTAADMELGSKCFCEHFFRFRMFRMQSIVVRL